MCHKTKQPNDDNEEVVINHFIQYQPNTKNKKQQVLLLKDWVRKK